MLGQFAAGAEFAFGTIVQRTMAEPGGARFHYGHPDVWNKLFTMTRGGVSKATRAFHISEDVFGGYNAIFRGAVIKYKEYMSVGKARDVGFAQINGFEAKVSGMEVPIASRCSYCCETVGISFQSSEISSSPPMRQLSGTTVSCSVRYATGSVTRCRVVVDLPRFQRTLYT